MAGEEGVCKNPEVSWCPEVLEGKVRGVPVFGATVRDVRNVADFVNVNPDLGHSGHFQDPMNRWDVCYIHTFSVCEVVRIVLTYYYNECN